MKSIKAGVILGICCLILAGFNIYQIVSTDDMLMKGWHVLMLIASIVLAVISFANADRWHRKNEGGRK